MQSNLVTVYPSQMLSFAIINSSVSFPRPVLWLLLRFHHRKQTLRVSNFPLVAIGTPAQTTSSHLLRSHSWRAMYATAVVEQRFECEQYAKSNARYFVDFDLIQTNLECFRRSCQTPPTMTRSGPRLVAGMHLLFTRQLTRHPKKEERTNVHAEKLISLTVASHTVSALL
jgi:hypothetical protein